MEASIQRKIADHLKMAAYHNKEATRLIESLEGGSPPSSRKGKQIISLDLQAKLISNIRKHKGTGRK